MAKEINNAFRKNGVSTSDTRTPVKDTPLGDFDSIDAFTKNGFVEIVEATKSLNAFPSGPRRDLYCAYPSFGKVIDLQSERILEIISKVLKWQNIRGNIQRRPPDEQFEMILECNDSMLERLGCNLDELAGIKKNPQATVIESCVSGKDRSLTNNGVSLSVGSWNNKSNERLLNMKTRLITPKNIARPQAKFQIPVDNSSSTPFLPKIKEKPNSLKPLAILPEYDESGCVVSYLHPYEFELMKFNVTQAQLCRKQPEKPLEMSKTDLVYVDTELRLQNALKELRNCTEIAVDVEHHSYRTFQGITCLIQISTRSKDYLFDALELRENLHALNEVFTNAKIVKIFHGADQDIEWLQRDLSLYIVNMFDSHQAAKILNLPRLSLAYLLKHYCDIDADKTFQLADWRMRPLPQELIDYARQDTHFLIYIYERLTNDILDAANNQTNLLVTVYQRSTDICKKRYFKPTITPETYLDLFRKSKRIFDNRQLYALREIFYWRDSVARTEDESYGFVLPNHMMLQIAESLPREMQGILACCNPVPPLVRQNLNIIHQIILRARQQPLVKPILETSVIHRVVESNTKDYNNKLYCPHDLSRCAEFRDDLPTLFNFKPASVSDKEIYLQSNSDECTNTVNMVKPELSILETVDNSEAIRSNLQRRNSMQYITPYERYLAILPQAEKEKLEEAARIEEENKKRKLCPAAPTANEAIIVKTEFSEQTNKSGPDDVDTLYSLPIRELLKRKYEEVMASRNLSDSDESSKEKHMDMANRSEKDIGRTKIKKHKNKSRSLGNQNQTDVKTQLFIKELLQRKFDEAMATKNLSNPTESLKRKRLAMMSTDEEKLVCTKIKKEKKSKIKSKKDKSRNSNKKQTIVAVSPHNLDVGIIDDYEPPGTENSCLSLVNGEGKHIVQYKKEKHTESKNKSKKNKFENAKKQKTMGEVARHDFYEDISDDDSPPENPSPSFVQDEDRNLVNHRKAKRAEVRKKSKYIKSENSKNEQKIEVVQHNSYGAASDNDEPPEEKPSTSLIYGEYQQLDQNHEKAKHAQKRNKKIRREAKRKSKQSSNIPIEETSFDYKNVDYKKFQGGAQRAEGIQLKHHFHGKDIRRKINNKKFNKLFTFSNVKGKK